MVDYVITGLTQSNSFVVYTGSTPVNVTYYGQYSHNTTSITIENIPFNTTFYVIIEDSVTKSRTSKYIRIESAYCENICPSEINFTLSPTYPPQPTTTVTPTKTSTPVTTPTISVTPSTSLVKIAVSATPTLTPSKTMVITPTVTPSVTASEVASTGCGYYSINYNPIHFYMTMQYTYQDCYSGLKTETINSGSTLYRCVVEENGLPKIWIPDGYGAFVTITRISNCGGT